MFRTTIETIPAAIPYLHVTPAQLEGELHDEARLLAALDLMISVDTMTAHLAGALGVPVWTLLQRDADWRWMEQRDDSSWYPTMRLFRQQRQGDWTTVIDRVIAALETFKASQKPRRC